MCPLCLAPFSAFPPSNRRPPVQPSASHQLDESSLFNSAITTSTIAAVGVAASSRSTRLDAAAISAPDEGSIDSLPDR